MKSKSSSFLCAPAAQLAGVQLNLRFAEVRRTRLLPTRTNRRPYLRPGPARCTGPQCRLRSAKREGSSMPDLTGLPALDLAIGLSFILLLLSLLASAVQELIASLLALRAKTLLRSLGSMLDGDDGPSKPTADAVPATTPDTMPASEPLSQRLYQHGLIRSLYKTGHGGPLKAVATGDHRLPSYIAPRAFALALLDTIAPDAALRDDGTRRPQHDVIAYVTGRLDDASLNLPARTRQALLALLKDARGDIDAFRQGVEVWFDESMARVSGWYKRQTQLILLAIAVAVTLLMNANALTMGERLWKDAALRAAVVQEAGKVTSPVGRTSETPSEAAERVEAALDRVDVLEKLGVPLGWTSDPDDPRFVYGTNDPWRFVHHDLVGWLFTIIAISLGAPFWFDTLSRLSRLRGTGKPEPPMPASALGKANERVTTASRD